jgi:hypothetical protein
MNVKYTKEILEPIVKDSKSITEIIKKLNKKFSGGINSHLKIKIKEFGIDISHFNRNGYNKGKSPINKLTHQEILVENRVNRKESTQRLRRALIESGREYKCEECGLKPVWNNKPICIQVDHKNGNWFDNNPLNLRFLCPNCHSQTETFGVKNAIMVS